MNRNFFLSLLTAMCLLPSFSHAQKKIALGGEFGLNNYAMQRMTRGGVDTVAAQMYSSRVGYRGGFVAMLTLGGHYHFQSGLSAVHYALTVDQAWRKTDVNLVYLQVPLNIMFTTHRDRGFMAGSGFYYGYAIGGNYKHTTTAGVTTSESIVYGKKGRYKRSDLGINTLILGWKFRNGLYVRVVHGLSVLNMTSIKGNKMAGDDYHFTVGYTFNKKKEEAKR